MSGAVSRTCARRIGVPVSEASTRPTIRPVPVFICRRSAEARIIIGSRDRLRLDDDLRFGARGLHPPQDEHHRQRRETSSRRCNQPLSRCPVVRSPLSVVRSAGIADWTAASTEIRND